MHCDSHGDLGAHHAESVFFYLPHACDVVDGFSQKSQQDELEQRGVYYVVGDVNVTGT